MREAYFFEKIHISIFGKYKKRKSRGLPFLEKNICLKIQSALMAALMAASVDSVGLAEVV
jgi:hypothetical protein